MIAGFATFRIVVYVLLALGLCFALTGFASSAYRKQRLALGEEHYRRGTEAARSGEPTQAAEEFRKALLFLPDNTQYRLSLATALLNSGHLNEAQAHLQQLLQDEPGNARVNLALAHVALKRGDVNKASDYYRQAVYEYWPAYRIPERRQARWELVKLLENSGRSNEAVGELMQLYASSPNDVNERARIGFELLRLGGVSEAGRIFRELETSYPHAVEAHRGLGDVYFAMGDYVSARHEFQHAQRVNPNDSESAEDLALVNTVIDLDPLLPRIGALERERRSRNLLSRVMADLTACSSGRPLLPDQQQEWDNANSFLQPKKGQPAAQPDDLQQAAVQLWRDRGSFCSPAKSPSDRAAEVALSRMSDE